MQNSALEQWLRFAPKPWPLSAGQKWHTYLSYPSAHRAWVLQLYDILVGLGYHVWVDRHGLTPGGELELSVERAITESDSAVLVWSAEAATSSWIAREYEYFLQRSVRHILVRLDQ